MSHDDCRREELSESWSFYSLWRLVQHEFQAINHKLDSIMSAVSVYITKQTAYNASVSTALDSVGTAVTGITGDIATLKDLITQLQNSQGTVTPEDQALLDAADAAGQALSDRATALAAALAALDDLTPPTPPAVP